MEATDARRPRGGGRPRRASRRARDDRPIRRDHRRRGARPGARSADLPDHRPRRRRLARTSSRSRRCRRSHSYSSLGAYDSARSSTRSSYVYRMPPREEPVAAFTFGSTAHAAFEAFTKERRERAARGEPPPTREDLEAAFRAQLDPDRLRRQGDRGGLPAARRDPARQLLDRRGQQPVGEALHEELDFELTLDAGRRRAARRHHRPDRPDRPPAVGRHRGHRLQDRHGLGPEGRRREPPAVDLRAGLPRRAGPRHARAGDAVLHGEALRLSHDADGRAAGPARADVLARVARMRAGEFAATPSVEACRYCDWRAMCPERV